MEKATAHMIQTNSAIKSEHYGDIMFYLGNVDAAVESWKKSESIRREGNHQFWIKK